ncbi:MAG TPA: M3 family oligoendopeptidase [Firmicutes bacterium]|nr:M3 family oligoendopeptidase [Bacillota bacterium]
MKLEQFPLIIPDIKKIEADFKIRLSDFHSATSAIEQKKVIDSIIKLVDEVINQFTVISVRYSQDTRVEAYQKAQDAIDEMGPLFQSLYNEYQRALVSSKFRPELEKMLGSFLFEKIELSIKTFDPKIIEELQKENRLTSQYSKLLASAQIPFDGQVYNLSQMGKFADSLDRKVRRKASEATAKWFADNETELARIYDDLVALRHSMSLKLGFENFIPLAYARMGRTDYTAKDVAGYRDQIRRSIVPLSKKLVKRQAERINIKQPLFYDLSLNFLTGNPTPKGDKDFLVNAAKEMYHEMGEEIGSFFDMMVALHMLDLEARPGKQGGGYMTYFPKYKMPFVFSNFNGTAGDVDVLTHEIGHAFQSYSSRGIKIPEYRDPTMEEAEIHSMSMEFFAGRWMEKFFKEDKDKYIYAHLVDALNFLPYGVSVDEFQHFVYENPTVSHAERCAKWREIEKKYTPYKKYTGFPIYEKGTRWMRQSHIYTSPFYYIDYTLAQVVAFQFLTLMEEDRDLAWARYVKLCKLGGRYPFTQLLKKAKMKNPFKQGTIARTVKKLDEILERFDDKKM